MEEAMLPIAERIHGHVFWDDVLHYYAKVEGTEDLMYIAANEVRAFSSQKIEFLSRVAGAEGIHVIIRVPTGSPSSTSDQDEGGLSGSEMNRTPTEASFPWDEVGLTSDTRPTLRSVENLQDAGTGEGALDNAAPSGPSLDATSARLSSGGYSSDEDEHEYHLIEEGRELRRARRTRGGDSTQSATINFIRNINLDGIDDEDSLDELEDVMDLLQIRVRRRRRQLRRLEDLRQYLVDEKENVPPATCRTRLMLQNDGD